MRLETRAGKRQDPRAPSLGSGALAGLFATYAMDLAGRRIIAPALGESSGGLGRWIGHMSRGRFTHEDITKAAPIAHEAEIGVVSHYGIGLILGVGYALLLRVPRARRSSFPSALGYGVATTVFPWFWMFPARGQGVLGLRAGDLRAPARALCAHAAYGVGLGLALRA